MVMSMEIIAELYTLGMIYKDRIYEEKMNILADMIFFVLCLNYKYSGSKYYEDATNYIINYFLQFLNELEREYQVYDKIMNYLGNANEDLSNINVMVLTNINDTYDDLTDYNENFYVFYCNLIDHIYNLLDMGILTKSNYKYLKYVESVDEDEKLRILSLIP